MAELVPRFNTTGDFTPVVDMVAVTPADGTDLQYGGAAQASRGFWVNAAGNIVIDTPNGNTVTLTISATQAGTIVWIKCKRIRATGTTATGIFACY